MVLIFTSKVKAMEADVLATIPDHDFWQFSLTLYDEPAVQEICLLFQERWHANVNLILFCCWFAQTGRGSLDLRDFKKMIAYLDPWHLNITEQIRQFRQSLKKGAGGNWVSVRKFALDQELHAEKIEQSILIQLIVRPEKPDTPVLKKTKDAISNLNAYYKIKQIKLTEEVQMAMIDLLSYVFPMMGRQGLADLCKPISLETPQEQE